MAGLSGKVFLVTGAARGMGRSHAVKLAQEGADLIVADICAPVDGLDYPTSTPQDMKATVAAIEQLGRRVVSAELDVRDAAALTEFVNDGVAQLGRLDGSVANAGVITSGTWDEVSDQDWRTVLDINLIGTWNACRATIPHLIDRGGSMVNISSAAGIKGTPLTVSYTASKHAVVGLTTALANELAQHSIRVNTVHPTGVPTGMTAPGLQNLLATRRSDLAPIYHNAMPVEFVDPMDVSNAVAFLLSDEARFITGTQLKVDAGVTIR